MKTFLIAVLVMYSSVQSFAQPGNDRVNTALKSGNAKELSGSFHNSVDLTILQKQGTYSKAQAEQIIQSFFDERKPTNYKANHSGKSGDGSSYTIGTLETSKGTIRVYIYYKKINDQDLIQTIRFESNE